MNFPSRKMAENSRVITFVITQIGATVKDVYFITSAKLIARNEIDDSAGTPVLLWEADMDAISASEYQILYSRMHSHLGI